MIKLNNYKEAKLQSYQHFISKSMHFIYGTRPDIVFAIGQLSKYNANPRKDYIQVASRIVQYSKEIIQLGLIYNKRFDETPFRDPPLYSLLGQVDNNFAGDLEDQKSVIEHSFFFNRVIISQSSKKPKTVSTSTNKFECVVFEYTAKKVV